MTTSFKLIKGNVTISLNDANYTYLSQYTPAVADFGADSVTESAIIIIDGNAALLDTYKVGIIKMLYNAFARQNNRSLDKTFIHFQPNGAAASYRSEILGGRIANEKNAHGEAWGKNAIEFTLIWTRRNYWEGDEVQVPLSNTNGTDNTAGLNIYNCNDGAGSSPNDRVNYCDIDGGDVAGDLPAATRIEMVNTYATSVLSYIWIAHNFTTPATFVWNYEGEDASGGTPTVDAVNSSGGDYNLLSVSSGPAFQELLTWTLTAAAVDAAKGGMVKALLRFSSSSDPADDIWWRFSMKVNGYKLWQSGRAKIDSNYGLLIRDILTFNLPPWLRGQTNQDEIDLILEGQQETGGTVAPKIDTLYLLPADGWRYIQTNDSIANGERVVDDGINDLVYVDDAAGDDKRSACVGYGVPIALDPAVNQRLYFLQHTGTGDVAQVDRLLVVKAFCRPRRYTI